MTLDEIFSFLALSSPNAYGLFDITLITCPLILFSLQAFIMASKFEPVPEIKIIIFFTVAY